MTLRVLVVLTVGAYSSLLVSCGYDQNTILEPTQAQPAAIPDLNFVSHAIAKALGQDVGLRNATLQSWRKSPVSAHKLVLQDYLRTPAGARLLNAVASAAELHPDQFLLMVDELPRLDFYVPLREHRMRWNGSTDVMVAATIDPDEMVITAYNVTGNSVILDRGHGIPEETIVLLHPEESKSRRVKPQSAPAGNVIQDPDDGELSGALVIVDENGVSREIEFFELAQSRTLAPAQQCYEECSGGGDSYQTFLYQYIVTFYDGWGDLEIEFRGKFYNSGTLVRQRTLRFDSESPNTVGTVVTKNALYFEDIEPTFSGHAVEVDVWETDSGFTGGDDFYGTSFHSFSENGSLQLIADGGVSNGDLSLTW